MIINYRNIIFKLKTICHATKIHVGTSINTERKNIYIRFQRTQVIYELSRKVVRCIVSESKMSNHPHAAKRKLIINTAEICTNEELQKLYM